MRKFEKISFKQFKKDVGGNEELYNSYELPKRKTKYSGAYDLCSLVEYTLKPGETYFIPTGMKYISEVDEIFLIFARSSLGCKYNVLPANGVGVIDSDYYNNETNEGHVFVALRNESNINFQIKIGDAVAQGVFTKYYTVDDEEAINTKRKGGFGSTNEGE